MPEATNKSSVFFRFCKRRRPIPFDSLSFSSGRYAFRLRGDENRSLSEAPVVCRAEERVRSVFHLDVGGVLRQPVLDADGHVGAHQVAAQIGAEHEILDRLAGPQDGGGIVLKAP